jgi:uncharacterized protein YyaL (SSP411 family)
MVEKSNKNTNKLIFEKSPYLQQHAHNPVKWYPWGEEAFEKAKDEDKPIFLSIGYSTCHWCHVMERESFEDNEVAELLNSNFVSIKVDREERPDIDDIYMTVCQMMTGQGGWPLTIIMTPDKKPFFTGTYIPKKSRMGMTGLLELIPKISQVWKDQRANILESAEGITETLKRYSKASIGSELDDSILTVAMGDLLSSFDENYGGFGSEPKFPTPHNLLFLLRNYKRTGSSETLHMVEKTLNAMGLGGIWDHVGGGFHRYSTDRFWLVPHFEKMLYDQAILAMAYTEVFQVTKKPEYKEVVKKIFEYIQRDMTSSDGGFFSAEDADSEGVEGKFYVWSEGEVKKVLGEQADLFNKVFGITKEGNFFEEVSGKKTSTNILHMKKDLDKWSKELDIPLDDLREQLESAREKLLNVRESRIRPHLDDKILCDWNGMMIAALSKAYCAFDEDRLLKSAETAAHYILKNMVDENGWLLHRIKDGEAKIPGFLSDYAYFVWGLLELYESTFNTYYLHKAKELIDHVNKHFWDPENLGYFQTADYAEELLLRKKESYDGAIPSANSVMMMNLLRLGRVTGDLDHEKRATDLQKAFSKRIDSLPTAHTMFLSATEFLKGPTYEIVVVGDLNSPESKEILKAVREDYNPNKVVVGKQKDDPGLEKLITYTSQMNEIEGKTTVYVCQDFSCNLPATDKETVLKLLNEGK